MVILNKQYLHSIIKNPLLENDVMPTYKHMQEINLDILEIETKPKMGNITADSLD